MVITLSSEFNGNQADSHHGKLLTFKSTGGKYLLRLHDAPAVRLEGPQLGQLPTLRNGRVRNGARVQGFPVIPTGRLADLRMQERRWS